MAECVNSYIDLPIVTKRGIEIDLDPTQIASRLESGIVLSIQVDVSDEVSIRSVVQRQKFLNGSIETEAAEGLWESSSNVSIQVVVKRVVAKTVDGKRWIVQGIIGRVSKWQIPCQDL